MPGAEAGAADIDGGMVIACLFPFLAPFTSVPLLQGSLGTHSL